MIGEKERQAVMRVLMNGTLSGFRGDYAGNDGGEEVQRLESEWCRYFGCADAIAVNSATSGLEMALAAIGIKQGDEVIVTPWSMTCSASLPLLFGAVPVFADIEPLYYCLDPESVRAKITRRTKAIIVVDLFGHPYAKEIDQIAKENDLWVIEDAAQAIDAKRDGRYCGTLGDIGVYSLNVHKHIHCGEGGVVVTDNPMLGDRLMLLRNHAEAVESDFEMLYHTKLANQDLVGHNYRMTEIHAAIAREQLKKLPEIMSVYRGYADMFDIPVREGCIHSYYKYALMGQDVMIKGGHLEIFKFCRGYVRPIYQIPLFRNLGYAEGQCPVCEQLQDHIIIGSLKEQA